MPIWFLPFTGPSVFLFLGLLLGRAVWVVVTWYVKICQLELKMCALYNCQSKIKISKNEFWKERKESRSEGKPHSWDEHTDNTRISTVQKTLRAWNPLGTFEATRSVSRLRRHRNSREDLPCVRGQGQAGEATSRPRPGAVSLRSHPALEARGGGREEQPEERWLHRRRRA